MKKFLMLCLLAALCSMTAFAATDSKLLVPDEYRFSASLPADLSAQMQATRSELTNKLEALEAEMAAAKMDGKNYDYLVGLAQEVRSELGMKEARPFGDYTPTLDEGGESCTSASLITGLPFSDVGYTCDNADDDNTDCANSGGPDVFYTFTPTADIEVRLTTCLPLTNFDTVLKIRDSAGNIIACNDDIGSNNACLLPTGQYWRSTIDCVLLNANERYCIIVDGFGWTDPNGPNYDLRCGNYQLVIEECGCALCPIGAFREGEPTCDVGYVDDYNSGCNFAESGLPAPVYTTIDCNMSVCGTSGNYVDAAGLQFRDTDWYLLTLNEESRVSWCVEATFNPAVAIVDLANGCDLPLNVVVYITGVECEETCVDTCLPAGQYALFVSTADFIGNPCGLEYSATVTCGPCSPPCEPNPPLTIVDLNQVSLPFYECLFICPEFESVVCVGPGLGRTQQPVLNILPGCLEPNFPGCFEPDCPPAFPAVGYWTYDPTVGVWCYHFTAAPGTAPGCVCLNVDHILPVELTNFDAIGGDASVTLNWTTGSETNNDHFDIVRDGTTVGRVTAENSATGSHYSWTETNLTNGHVYSYTLISVDVSGISEELETASATPSMSAATITEYALLQNYPNPFNPETNITFDLLESGEVTLTVYNALGQTIATLVNGSLAAGRHTVNFDAANLPSGLYFYRMEAGEFSAIKKMVLMK